jgi:hypothetical protein
VLAFASIGASLAAQSIADSGYLDRLGSPLLSTSISGVSQGAIVLAGFAPVLGGVVIQRYGYEVLFALSIIVGLGAVLSSGMLVGVSGRQYQRAYDVVPEQSEFPALPAPRA